MQSRLFNRRERGGKVFVSPDYNRSMEQQREMTWKRIEYLLERGVFKGWMAGEGEDVEMKMFACSEVLGIFDHSISIKLGVHFVLWGGAIQFAGTQQHHDKWLRDTENFKIKGWFSTTELGHGSNVRGIETVTTYDSKTGEFVNNTPCESTQNYWIVGAAKHATHTILLSQLVINGTNEGVHALIAQIRDGDGNVLRNIRIADCGHKNCLNGVDNGRIWFDNVRVPRENLLSSVADVSPDGEYLSSIKDPDQRFSAFLTPMTAGRVNVAVNAVYQSKVGLTIAISANQVNFKDFLMLQLCYDLWSQLLENAACEEDTPIKQDHSRLLLHGVTCKILQECREDCGGQGLKTENRVGHLKAEHDVQSTFEGNNYILMQQTSWSRGVFIFRSKIREAPDIFRLVLYNSP
ncbi:Acyl-coenzyme A oxidase 3, peroxisomal [Hibiscus syriacus]|uniref:Acyl-coenzyme A oxidase 3, peroxisomal n=1 Tax=Hibiscus syriacus TaxID=106335 RepID=A0A6A2XJK3_HIBSY|nr:Acyl-coenzyme A oxidase 3, peroxisomal [Hibiscus syriacus]